MPDATPRVTPLTDENLDTLLRNGWQPLVPFAVIAQAKEANRLRERCDLQARMIDLLSIRHSEGSMHAEKIRELREKLNHA